MISRLPPLLACITIFNRARAEILMSLKKLGSFSQGLAVRRLCCCCLSYL